MVVLTQEEYLELLGIIKEKNEKIDMYEKQLDLYEKRIVAMDGTIQTLKEYINKGMR